MTRELVCADMGMDCDKVIQGESDEEVMSQAAVHARDVHGMDSIDGDTQAQIQSLIHDA